MCLAIPGKVIGIKNGRARVRYPGNIVNPALITDEKVEIGDSVLVQMGIIIKILTPAEASVSRKAWEK